jgi:hypothetical protein
VWKDVVELVRCEVSLQKFGIVFPERATPNVAWVVDVGLLAITTRLNPVGCECKSGQVRQAQVRGISTVSRQRAGKLKKIEFWIPNSSATGTWS